MNSRDAAYDEEELIRRAIEESKEDTKSLPDDTSSRRGKRSRSESEACVIFLFPHIETCGSVADIPLPDIEKAPNAREPALRLLLLLSRRKTTLCLNLHLMMSPKRSRQ